MDEDNRTLKLDKFIPIITAIIVFFILKFIVGTFISSYDYFISSYNQLIDLEENAKQAKSEVEIAMQRRLELLPDLMATVQAAEKASNHSEDIYSALQSAQKALDTAIENGADSDIINEANVELSKQINNALAIIEDSPNIISGNEYRALMDQIEGSINRIAATRSEYNEAVSEYNRSIRKFPGKMVAQISGFEELEQFESDEEAKKTQLLYFE